MTPEDYKAKLPAQVVDTVLATQKQSSQYMTEQVDLPSKGKCYPKSNPLSSGVVNLRYMTTKEEDILSNQQYIQKGNVIEKLLQALIVDNINYDDLLLGDKDALIMAARILGYGSNYDVELVCSNCNEKRTKTIDLFTLKDAEINTDLLNELNEYEFTLPKSGVKLTFKLLTIADDKAINEELKAIGVMNKKLNKKEGDSVELTTRLKRVIIAIDDKRDQKIIRDFVDHMLAYDSLAFRKHLKTITPTINREIEYVCDNCDTVNQASLPMTVHFFWPTV